MLSLTLHPKLILAFHPKLSLLFRRNLFGDLVEEKGLLKILLLLQPSKQPVKMAKKTINLNQTE
ncbi:MAG: hypothetical protein Q4C95_12220 [Planctomycetia bacterium]|nr:hypothetical protein [Planctomycetia bacterium]